MNWIHYWQKVWHIAVWEFQRFFKWKEQLFSVVLAIVAGLGWYGYQSFAERRDSRPINLLVLDLAEGQYFSAEESIGRFNFTIAEGEDISELQNQVTLDDDLTALLVIDAEGVLTLHGENTRRWRDSLRTILLERHQMAMLRSVEVQPEALAALSRPFQFSESTLEGEKASGNIATRSQNITVFGFTIIMFILLIIGNVYLFVGITGEKSSRMTEQVVAAVPAQAWIDGKLVGIGLLSMVNFLNLLGSILIFLLVGSIFQGRMLISGDLLDFEAILICAPLAALGFFLWFAVFGAIAATIDNPYNSNRAIFMYLPLIPYLPVITSMDTPNSMLMVFMSYFPFSSTMAFPVRWVNGYAGILEYLIVIALLVVAIWFFRMIAGKIFKLGILMYGKEPSFGEIAKWARES